MSLNTLVQPDPKSWLNQFKFHIPVRVRFAETDALGHVNSAVTSSTSNKPGWIISHI